MANLFLSYSRRDRDFAGRLVDALRQREHGVWMDTKDIPPTAEWREEIAAAIRDADGVVFVITPDSVASQECLRELEAALANGKRLLPVLRDDVEHADRVPPELARWNWVRLREQDSFEGGLTLLHDAIVTDLAWQQVHTRLVGRSAEWEAKGRDDGLLLRGAPLPESEVWLARADGERRIATPLQRAYIVASRQAASRRRRRLALVVVAGAVAALALGAALVIQRRARLLEADRKESERLASESREASKDHLDRALLLALAALDRQDGVAARASLKHALDSHPLLTRFLAGHRGSVRSLAMAPGGTRLASGGCGAPRPEPCPGQIVLWDLRRGPALEPPGEAIGAEVRSLAFSPDGATLAAGSTVGSILLWGVNERPLRRIPDVYVDRIDALAFQPPDGAIVAVAAQNSNVRLLHVATGELAWWASDDARGARSVAFDPTGRLLAAGTDRWLALWNTRTHAQIDRRFGGDERVRLNDPHPGAVAEAVAFTSGGRVLVAGSAGSDITFWDVASGRQLGKLSTGDQVWSLAVSGDGLTLAAAVGQDVKVWKAGRSSSLFENPKTQELSAHAAAVTSVAMSNSGDRVASSDEDGRVLLWDLGQVSRLALAHPTPAPDADASARDGDILASAEGDFVRLTVRAAGRTDVRELPLGGAVRCVALSPSGDLVAYAGEADTIVVAPVARSDALTRFAVPYRPVTALAFDSAGSRLAAAACRQTDTKLRCGSSTLVFDLDSRKLLQEHGQQEREVSSLAFGQDLLASANEKGDVVLVERPTTKSFRAEVLADPAVSLTAVALSPDASLLATGSSSGSVRLWDVAARRPLGERAQAHADAIRSLAFTADGKSLISRARDRALTWSVGIDAWIEVACATANRNLSRAEWDDHLGASRPYRRLCPGLPPGNETP